MDGDQEDSVSGAKSGEPSPTGINIANASGFSPNRWVKLNVGGQIYATTIDTLVGREPDSMLARMFLQDGSIMPSERDEQGAFLIDRSPRYFEPIINYLRHGQFVCDSNISVLGVLEEARFFGIFSLVTHLEERLGQQEAPLGDKPLTRNDVIKAIIQTSVITELRFQGVNLSGADLRKLDFRNINFKEGANLRGCNFEDPTGVRTNLEGVNLKGACLESSNMAGVNLRVANLKNANMKNCNLRAAVLAGADLEKCNLSGSDLQEANLRGANLKDAELTLMVTPLHMSQAIR
ncbi:BTB/POZ domain-containing protein KCTD9 isoform X2 [Drosophila biarmipes]|uniref:BTB/POZ domain-containing protein KCTD9 isoform X2 n=1 Tax=Drosophila biarmipes TaxID=125945 RepID=UPI0007E81994|nr:BTB/POZ domain-containing protein KCTD9 isoform X2 [Drosophila biarmipes]